MKAVTHTGFGAPEEVLHLQDVEAPAIGPDEVLVRVEANAIAKGDWLIARGWPFIARPTYGIRTPKHRIAGLEFSGVVESIGSGVTGFSPGDEVFGWGNGGLAEFTAVPADQLAPKPEGITFEEAAAIPVSGLAALQAVRDQGEVGEGQKVLITGASGGVGSFAVQIAKALGAEVTGVAGTRNLDLVRTIGADRVVDYVEEEIPTDGRFDVIIDIAGNRPVSLLRRALAPRGTLVIVGGSGGKWTMGFGRTIRALLAGPFVKQRLRALISGPNRDDLLALAELVEAGRMRPIVGSTHALSEAAGAIARVGDGGGSGKAVVRVAA